MRLNRLLLIFGVGFILASTLVLTIAPAVKAQELGPVIDEGLFEEASQGLGLDAVGCTRTNTAPQNLANEQRVVELVNIEGGKVGLPPLKRNSELDFGARDHTRDLVEDNYFSHDTKDWVNGELKFVCNFGTRIKLYYTGYSLAGENLIAGTLTPEAAVQGWMNSPGHRDNMLKPEYKEIGVGYYSGPATYTHYWGQTFGYKSDVYPVIINNEASITTTPLVGFYVYGKGVWAEMRTRDNAGSWTNWTPFQEYVTFQLEPTNGTHTLSVEMRAAGALTPGAVSSDTIELTNIPTIVYDNAIFLPFVKR